MTDLAALYTRYAPDVLRFALYLSGNREEAADITSETFVRAWTSPEPIRMATLKGYLFTIARNLYLQGLRRGRRQVPLPDELLDPAAGPLAQAERSSEMEVALAGLQRLAELDRAALLMRVVDELPYEEIARALGLSPAAARVRVHRARRQMIALRDEPPGDAPS
jgi:RNA polymerase sigma-70 factor (ECF subfamily)